MSSRVIDLINKYDRILDRAGIEAPRRNIERLLEKILGLKKIDLYLNPNTEISPENMELLDDLIRRRLNFEPLQYILGETEFYGLKFKSDSRALIPRPETEFVVSEALELLKDSSGLNILDLACGSGNIVVSLTVTAPDHKYSASDISSGAVALAQENAELNSVEDKIEFYTGSLFEPFKDANLRFDLICANPPYIKTAEREQLHEQVREYEPNQALFSGEDGLDFIREMLAQAPDFLSPQGYLIFEIALGQVADIKSILNEQGEFDLLKIAWDYNDIERVLVLRLRE